MLPVEATLFGLSEFQHGTPAELFEAAYFRTASRHAAYDVADDGRFFLVKPEPVSPSRQLNVVLKWFEELERLVPTDN